MFMQEHSSISSTNLLPAWQPQIHVKLVLALSLAAVQAAHSLVQPSILRESSAPLWSSIATGTLCLCTSLQSCSEASLPL